MSGQISPTKSISEKNLHLQRKIVFTNIKDVSKITADSIAKPYKREKSINASKQNTKPNLIRNNIKDSNKITADSINITSRRTITPESTKSTKRFPITSKSLDNLTGSVKSESNLKIIKNERSNRIDTNKTSIIKNDIQKLEDELKAIISAAKLTKTEDIQCHEMDQKITPEFEHNFNTTTDDFIEDSNSLDNKEIHAKSKETTAKTKSNLKRKQVNTESQKVETPKKIRHYDPKEAREYIKKQKQQRQNKLQEEIRFKKCLQEEKKRKLKELQEKTIKLLLEKNKKRKKKSDFHEEDSLEDVKSNKENLQQNNQTNETVDKISDNVSANEVFDVNIIENPVQVSSNLVQNENISPKDYLNTVDENCEQNITSASVVFNEKEEKEANVSMLDYSIESTNQVIKSPVHIEKNIEVVKPDQFSALLEIKPNPKAEDNVPYWLEPSKELHYPYNFINAVKRKLNIAIYGTPEVNSGNSSIEKVSPVIEIQNEGNFNSNYNTSINNISVGLQNKYCFDNDQTMHGAAKFDLQNFKDKCMLQTEKQIKSLDVSDNDISTLSRDIYFSPISFHENSEKNVFTPVVEDLKLDLKGLVSDASSVCSYKNDIEQKNDIKYSNSDVNTTNEYSDKFDASKYTNTNTDSIATLITNESEKSKSNFPKDKRFKFITTRSHHSMIDSSESNLSSKKSVELKHKQINKVKETDVNNKNKANTKDASQINSKIDIGYKEFGSVCPSSANSNSTSKDVSSMILSLSDRINNSEENSMRNVDNSVLSKSISKNILRSPILEEINEEFIKKYSKSPSNMGNTRKYSNSCSADWKNDKIQLLQEIDEIISKKHKNLSPESSPKNSIHEIESQSSELSSIKSNNLLVKPNDTLALSDSLKKAIDKLDTTDKNEKSVVLSSKVHPNITVRQSLNDKFNADIEHKPNEICLKFQAQLHFVDGFLNKHSTETHLSNKVTQTSPKSDKSNSYSVEFTEITSGEVFPANNEHNVSQISGIKELSSFESDKTLTGSGFEIESELDFSTDIDNISKVKSSNRTESDKMSTTDIELQISVRSYANRKNNDKYNDWAACPTNANTLKDLSKLCAPLKMQYFSAEVIEQQIRAEETQLQHFETLLKMREKSLEDRTKGELAWLEVTKKQLKSNGQINEASAVKKKQRGLLLKLQQEKHEMKRLKAMHKASCEERKVLLLSHQRQLIKGHLTTSCQPRLRLSRDSSRTPRGPVKALRARKRDTIDGDITKSPNKTNVSKTVNADYRLNQTIAADEQSVLYLSTEGSGDSTITDLKNYKPRKAFAGPPEEWMTMLANREKELGERRQKVEELLKWHRQLSEEEKRVGALEAEAELLALITKAKTTDVQIKGTHLKKLWAAMTRKKTMKFNEEITYNLSKVDLEKFYKLIKRTLLQKSNATVSADVSVQDSTCGQTSDFLNSSECKSEFLESSYISKNLENIINKKESTSEEVKSDISVLKEKKYVSDESQNKELVSEDEKTETSIETEEKKSEILNLIDEDINSKSDDISTIETNDTLKDKDITEDKSDISITIENSENVSSIIEDKSNSLSSIVENNFSLPKSINVNEEKSIESENEHNSLHELNEGKSTISENINVIEDIDIFTDDFSSVSEKENCYENQEVLSEVSLQRSTCESKNSSEEIVTNKNKNDVIFNQSFPLPLNLIQNETLLENITFAPEELTFLGNTVSDEISKNDIQESSEISIKELSTSENNLLIDLDNTESSNSEFQTDNETPTIHNEEVDLEKNETVDVEEQLEFHDEVEKQNDTETHSEEIKSDEAEEKIDPVYDFKVEDEPEDKENIPPAVKVITEECSYQTEIENQTEVSKILKNDANKELDCKEDNILSKDSETIQNEEKIENSSDSSSTIEEQYSLSEKNSQDSFDSINLDVETKNESSSDSSSKDSTKKSTTDNNSVDVRQRVSDILSKVTRKSPRMQELWVTIYDVNESSEFNSPTDTLNKSLPISSINKSIVSVAEAEAEALFKKQLEVEKEIKRIELEQQQQGFSKTADLSLIPSPYLFVREIPNKPPPPYTPPVSSSNDNTPPPPSPVVISSPPTNIDNQLPTIANKFPVAKPFSSSTDNSVLTTNATQTTRAVLLKSTLDRKQQENSKIGDVSWISKTVQASVENLINRKSSDQYQDDAEEKDTNAELIRDLVESFLEEMGYISTQEETKSTDTLDAFWSKLGTSFTPKPTPQTLEPDNIPSVVSIIDNKVKKLLGIGGNKDKNNGETVKPNKETNSQTEARLRVVSASLEMWSARRRDPVDIILAEEAKQEERSWVDLRIVEQAVKESMVQAVTSDLVAACVKDVTEARLRKQQSFKHTVNPFTS